MGHKVLKLFCLILLISISTSKPADADKKSRIVKKELSDEEHYQDDHHNPDYDHEAFLGQDEAEVFDSLPPEESKRRLGVLVAKVDRDEDGKVTVEELKQWIDYTQRRYITDDAKRQWSSHNHEQTPTLSLALYQERVYGFMDDLTPEELAQEDGTYQKMKERDERRWKLADENGDGALSLEEFTNFLHPEESAHMRDIVVVETMEDIDKDKDGKISVDEYIGDMYSGSNDDTEPSWVNSEREQFSQFRDKDGDGVMDREEVHAWISPPDYDHSLAEARHLLAEADEDKDGVLTKEEILDQYDVFVGSQITDFGEALTRHDEF